MDEIGLARDASVAGFFLEGTGIRETRTKAMEEMGLNDWGGLRQGWAGQGGARLDWMERREG